MNMECWVDILRAKKATEFMAMERIQQFLLADQKEKYLESLATRKDEAPCPQL